MASTDIIGRQLSDLYPKIAARRVSDPILDEICCDCEELMLATNKSGTSADQMDGALQKDLNVTILALLEEIQVRLEHRNH